MTEGRSLARRLPQTPFWILVAHFVKSIFAGEEEQSAGSMSFGIGAVLAILASPGAFASIFLLDKYSPLMQWLRGIRHFDPYRASVADEYFFVVLSMTITGLVMVLRWNRLFPDRRDFVNLAVLPIAIRDIFVANFAALFGLALVFAIDVNAVSAFLFPAIVTMSNGSVSAFLRVAVSHATAVFSASLFSFFAVFALVGVLMLILPKRLFRPVSILIRLLLIVGLLTEFFSNVFVQLLTGRLPGQSSAAMRLLPSFWFLGVYENVLGIAKPAMAVLGHQALVALLAAVAISVIAYSLCYRTQFLRLAQSLDTLGPVRHALRLVLPVRLEKVFFRSPFEHGSLGFVLKVLLRSERHLMFFGGYLGIGLVIVAQTLLDPSGSGRSGLPSVNVLEIPMLIAFFIVTGVRFVFDMPAVFGANWIFRLTIENADALPNSVARKFARCAVLSWEILLLSPIMGLHYGWKTSLVHTAVLVLISLLMIETVFAKFAKIPFTCATEPDIRRLLMRILGTIFAVLTGVPLVAAFEHWALTEPLRFIPFTCVFVLWGYLLHRYRTDVLDEERRCLFEDRAPPAFELLKLE